MIVGYAPLWIFEFHLEMVEFRVTTHECLQKLPSSRFTTSISIGCYSIIVAYLHNNINHFLAYS